MHHMICMDLEFTGLQKNTTIISLTLMDVYGNSFYAEFTDYDRSQCNKWIRDHVIAGLRYPDLKHKDTWKHTNHTAVEEYVGDRDFIREKLEYWFERLCLTKEEKAELIVDVGAFDWVLFCDLFGGAFEIPECIYYAPIDLSDRFRAAGLDPDTNRAEFSQLEGLAEHNSFDDARATLACFVRLEKMIHDTDPKSLYKYSIRKPLEE